MLFMKEKRAVVPQEGRLARVGPDDLKGSNIQKAVLNDCLTHSWSIFPWSGGVAVGLVGVVALSPAVVGVGVGLLFIGSSTFIWNYVVNGENRAIEKVNTLRQLRRQQSVTDLGDLAELCSQAGFTDGANKAGQIKEAFGHLVAYLHEKSGVAVDGWRVLAEDTFKQGFATLADALDVFKAIESVDVAQLQGEIKGFNTELAKLDATSVRARTLKLSIQDHQKRIDLVETNKDQLAELLQRTDEIEAAMQEAMLKLASMGNRGSTSLLDDGGGPAQRLRSAVDAAKRVEERMRGKSDAETAALRSQYIDAAREDSNSNINS
jgi:hypothetical protein